MGTIVSSRKTVLLLFLAFVRSSQSHSSAETFNDASHYERNYNLQANRFTTPTYKISDDLYDGIGANFFDGLDGRYLASVGENDEEGQSWPTKAKRRWAENSMSVWGKRSNVGQGARSSPSLRRMWSENSMAVWGKRTKKPQLKEMSDLLSSPQTHQRQQNDISYDFNIHQLQTPKQMSDLLIHQPVHKRRWAENSMSVWGKRDSSKNLADPSAKADNGALQTTTRELQANGYSINANPDQERLLKILHRKHWEPKRNWATNTMNVWGKRETEELRGQKNNGIF